jgi:hypothetical protein
MFDDRPRRRLARLAISGRLTNFIGDSGAGSWESMPAGEAGELVDVIPAGLKTWALTAS